jgi:hypothetical protein
MEGRLLTSCATRDGEIKQQSGDPLRVLIQEETLACDGPVYLAHGVISASYDRLCNGAYVPVTKLGPRTPG